MRKLAFGKICLVATERKNCGFDSVSINPHSMKKLVRFLLFRLNAEVQAQIVLLHQNPNIERESGHMQHELLFSYKRRCFCLISAE